MNILKSLLGRSPQKRERVFINFEGSPYSIRGLSQPLRGIARIGLSSAYIGAVGINFGLAALNVCCNENTPSHLATNLAVELFGNAYLYCGNRIAARFFGFAFGLNTSTAAIDKSGMAGGNSALRTKTTWVMGLIGLASASTFVRELARAIETSDLTQLNEVCSLVSLGSQAVWHTRCAAKIHSKEWVVYADPPPLQRPARSEILARLFKPREVANL